MNASIRKVLRAVAVLALAVAGSSVAIGTAIAPAINPSMLI